MSAEQDTRGSVGYRLPNGEPSVCRVVDDRNSPGMRWPRYWTVVNGKGQELDRFKTQSCAEYAARLLNSGTARIDPHAIVGCKVVAS